MGEWKQCTIADLGMVITGKTPSTKITELWEGTVHFVTPKDIQGLKHITNTERRITDAGLQKVKGSALPPRAVCVSCIGNIGYTGMTTQKCVTNQQINSIIVNSDNDPDFVYYLMRYLWPFFKNHEGQSTTLSILNKTQFSKISVTVPDKATQKRIAEVLSALDEKIAANARINDNLQQQALAIFQHELLRDGELPEGWKNGSLLDIANYLNGLAMQKFRPAEGEVGLPVLKIKELRQGSCDASSELCSSSIKPEYIIHDGDVIFSWSGSLLVDLWCGGTCGLNQHLFKVTSEKYPKWFYYAWTAHHLARFVAIAADKATTMGHIKREELAKAAVVIPDAVSMERIGGILQPMYDLIISNRVENRKLASLRDTVLPQLMSGELDVSALI